MTVSESDERHYRRLFLSSQDVPDLEAREAVHSSDAEAGDDAWVACHGIEAGFQVWQRIQGTELARVVDVRWLFPSEANARRYDALRVGPNAEGFLPVPGFSVTGTDVAAFAGQDPFGLGGEMHIYLFVLGRVAAKVFVSGLEADDGRRLVRRAVERVRSAIGPAI